MQISTNRFAGPTVIVTGAGSGIGRATERLTELTNEFETDHLVLIPRDIGWAAV